MDGYRRGGHTKYSLKVHIILVTKYRKAVFTRMDMSDDVKQALYEAASGKDTAVLRMETNRDHVHNLLEYSPAISIAEIVSMLKQHSTYVMWKRHHQTLAKRYWKHRLLWSDGYFACSIGQVSQSVIERYIENQG